jgi:hypothetical protein
MSDDKPALPAAQEPPDADTKHTVLKARRRRKKRRRVREELAGFVIRVSAWDYYYALRISDPKSRWDIGPCSELATLTIAGEIIRPQDSKYKKASITLTAKDGMMQENKDPPPTSIGTLSANKDELSAYIFCPSERMGELAGAAQSGRLQIIQLGATRLRYGSARVTNFSLNTEVNEEDW